MPQKPLDEKREDALAGCCIWCDAPLGDGGDCPRCGRGQSRVCVCGHELARQDDVCPSCGIELRGVVKVRRKRRRGGVKVAEMLGYAAVGILVAVGATALVNGVIGGLALKSANGGDLPESPVERWALASRTLRGTYDAMASAAAERFEGVGPFIIMAAAGAIIGTLYYLRQSGALVLRRRQEDTIVGVKKGRRV